MSVVFFAQFDEENLTLSEHTCLTNHTIGWDESKLLPLIDVTSAFVWKPHLNSAHARFNRDDGGLLPEAYLHLVRKKGSELVSI